MAYLYVFLGAGLGGAMRHAINQGFAHMGWTGFPFSTGAINILGSFMMGLLIELFALKFQAPQPARLFLTTGVLGGFTTFSTFSLEAALLWERGRIAHAAAYVLGSVALSLGGLFLALALVRHLARG